MLTGVIACLLSSVRVYFEMGQTELRDDDLTNFERHGAGPLPAANDQGYVNHEGARIWCATLTALVGPHHSSPPGESGLVHRRSAACLPLSAILFATRSMGLRPLRRWDRRAVAA